jgi:hypothetical protein
MKNDKDLFFFQMVCLICLACLIAVMTLLSLINKFLQ